MNTFIKLWKQIILCIFFCSFIINSYACPICKEDIQQGARCIDVGGYSLYTLAMGSGPTVVFEAGLGDSTPMWDKVTPQVKKFAHVFIYDRNGLGRSQEKPNDHAPRTAQQAVDNLRLLLAQTRTPPPYVLMGHSLGGLYMQLFAQEYPREVAAVVLVDSATRDEPMDKPLPPIDASYYWEARGMKISAEQVKEAPPFPPIPLFILTSSQRGEEWLELQKGLLKLSPQSEQAVTNESGHYIQREEPDLVINTLKKAVQKARSVLTTQAFIDARNKHDIHATLNLFSDNIVWHTSWGEVIKGKRKLREMLEQQFKDHITNEIIDGPIVNDGTVKLVRRATLDSWKRMGINYLDEDSVVTLKDNKIVQWDNRYTPESQKKLNNASQNKSHK